MVFVVDGERNTLYEPKKGKPSWHGDDRQVFMAQARQHGHVVVDMQPVFEEHWRQRAERLDFLPMDGHWNKVAHGLAAQHVMPLLLPAGSHTGAARYASRISRRAPALAMSMARATLYNAAARVAIVQWIVQGPPKT